MSYLFADPKEFLQYSIDLGLLSGVQLIPFFQHFLAPGSRHRGLKNAIFQGVCDYAKECEENKKFASREENVHKAHVQKVQELLKLERSKGKSGTLGIHYAAYLKKVKQQ
jgi:hypothetical protein